MSRYRVYLFSLLLMALIMALFVAPVQAAESCCCQPVAAQESCCDETPAENLASCVMSCDQPTRHDIGFLIQLPAGFVLSSSPVVGVELPKPPKKPAPPKSLVSRVVEEWNPPPSPPVAALNINLPPPSSLLL